MSGRLIGITPDWPAPPSVRAFCTTRLGGVSLPPYDSLNLGDHVHDDAQAVTRNRTLLRAALALPHEPCWLNQVHGNQIVEASAATLHATADAGISNAKGQACVVLSADCLPVLLCDDQGSRVAAVHAGWRGLVAGIIETTVDAMDCTADRLLAWLGPAISGRFFEIGKDVRDSLAAQHAVDAAFIPTSKGRWLADLCVLARERLARCGITRVYGGDWCTFSDQQRFFSYRRDGVTGRMANLIWLV